MTNRNDVDTDDLSPERLLVAQLETIERAIAFAARRGALRDEESEDFASFVKLKLIENGYAIIRKHDRRASFGAFISIVVQRLLLDYRIRQWGKWHASAEAKRIGEPAIAIEAMLYRDGRTIEEVLPVLIRRWPEMTRQSAEGIVRRLPLRTPRLRTVDLELASDAHVAPVSAAELFESDRIETARRIAAIVRETITALREDERLIFRLRFEGGMSVAEVSRVLKTEQKPLYRKLQRALLLLRKRLEEAGVSAADAEELIASRGTDLDFGFGGAAPPLNGRSVDEEGV